MYKNKFLAIIKKDGKPVRELAGAYVHLPFDTEYSIELRNDNRQRALAKISIDGTEVVSGGIVVDGYSSVTIERFVLDGNMDKGNKFKFVAVDDAPGIDPSNIRNGVVEISFQLEKPAVRQRPPFATTSTISYYPDGMSGSILYRGASIECSTTSTAPTRTLLLDAVNSVNCYYSDSSTMTKSFKSNVGVTTEGSISKQKFQEVTMGELETDTTTIYLFLKGVDNFVTIKIYCTQCGKKTKSEHSFCPHCGTRIELE